MARTVQEIWLCVLKYPAFHIFVPRTVNLISTFICLEYVAIIEGRLKKYVKVKEECHGLF